MKTNSISGYHAILKCCLTAGVLGLCLSLNTLPLFSFEQPPQSPYPYREYGLSDREAAIHVLNRFSFGTRESDIEEVLRLGLEGWIDQQVKGIPEDPFLDSLLSRFASLKAEPQDIATRYIRIATLLRQATAAGKITAKDIQESNRDEIRERLIPFMKSRGLSLEVNHIEEVFHQKVLRAVYSRNQLREVMVDFWQNHFYVSASKLITRPFLWDYERTVIRPHVFGHFDTLLRAVAMHPAMLLYLDNAQSTASDGSLTSLQYRIQQLEKSPQGRAILPLLEANLEAHRKYREDAEARLPEVIRNNLPRKGLNENYARELLELHTLGVDGGYTQADVVATARILTGWGIIPVNNKAAKLTQDAERGKAFGFYRNGHFLFRPDVHDAGEKVVLGTRYPTGGGLEEGLELLKRLAAHPSTARHIAHKFAVRFISDSPSEETIRHLAAVFEASGGQLTGLIHAALTCDEFWMEATQRSKIKTPFDFVISALRASHCDITDPKHVILILNEMGHRPYSYTAPTGYPEHAEAWVNTGALIARVNFGIALSLGKIKGVSLPKTVFTDMGEPESLEHSILRLGTTLLPGRSPEVLYNQVLPFLSIQDLETALKQVQPNDSLGVGGFGQMDEDDFFESGNMPVSTSKAQNLPRKKPLPKKAQRVGREPVLSISSQIQRQCIGLILGSPEFQRR